MITSTSPRATRASSNARTVRFSDVLWLRNSMMRRRSSLSGQTISSYLLQGWQDVIFYGVIG
jgi:hypothetical protein